MKQLVPGVLFAALWASASAATKFGLAMANPFALANVRFLIAGGLMLVYTYTRSSSDNALPKGKEWKQLLLFSLLNTTIYLSAFVLALKEVSAGIGSLSTATTPLFITLLSALWLKRRLYWYEWCGLVLGLLGVVLAAYPLLHTSYVTAKGLIIIRGNVIGSCCHCLLCECQLEVAEHCY
jgi:probable blue pigment (indigoidine) exporter